MTSPASAAHFQAPPEMKRCMFPHAARSAGGNQYVVRVGRHLMSIITPLQMKLARTAVGLGVRELAAAAEVAPSTVQRYESRRGDMHVRTLAKVQEALEQRGVVFIPADASGGPGLRLKS